MTRTPVAIEVNEEAVTFAEAEFLFRDLIQVNAMLTNTCNLNCSYCYEQHTKDFGRFTIESLKQTYDWLNARSNSSKKVFQFFGGEPLIHRTLIKEFLVEHDDELSANYDNYRGTYISMCTNGLLLNKSFIDFYFSKPYTHMMISIDTFDIDIDHREMTPAQYDRLVVSIKQVIDALDDPMRLVVRATLSEETAAGMTEFIDKLYGLGVRNVVVHPLILDSSRGYISWSDTSWNSMRTQVFNALDTYADLYIKFSEGVGVKEDSNCMVGSHMVAIDASGDFSGCYFFTNQKADAGGGAILGNVFNDKIYINRYKQFQNAYKEMFETNEQCKTCNYQNACYQCPAGNMDTGVKMFRPDDMCQQIVKLYVDFQQDVAKKIFMRNINMRVDRVLARGIKVIAAEVSYFRDVYFNRQINDLEHYMDIDLKDYKSVLADWLAEIDSKHTFTELELDEFLDILSPNTSNVEITNDFTRCFYIQCISTIIFNPSRQHETNLSTLLA